jgi:hypothetical protein
MLDQFIVLAQETGQEAAHAAAVPPIGLGLLAFAGMLGLLGLTWAFAGLHASRD